MHQSIQIQNIFVAPKSECKIGWPLVKKIYFPFYDKYLRINNEYTITKLIWLKEQDYILCL